MPSSVIVLIFFPQNHPMQPFIGEKLHVASLSHHDVLSNMKDTLAHGPV